MESKAAFFFLTCLDSGEVVGSTSFASGYGSKFGCIPQKMNAEKNGTHIKDEGRP